MNLLKSKFFQKLLIVEEMIIKYSSTTNFIFILGDLEGVINLKVDYINGSSDLIQTICSSDDYLIEQL